MLYEQYKDRAAFYVVYIREAHPSNAWQTASNVRENIVFVDPKTFEERTAVAESCVRKLGIKIPALVDGVGEAGGTCALVVADNHGGGIFSFLAQRAAHVAFRRDAPPGAKDWNEILQRVERDFIRSLPPLRGARGRSERDR